MAKHIAQPAVLDAREHATGCPAAANPDREVGMDANGSPIIDHRIETYVASMATVVRCRECGGSTVGHNKEI